MNQELTSRKANIVDLKTIISLYLEDELGSSREKLAKAPAASYIKAFNMISEDPNQYLMIVESADEIVGTCHLTIMPSLTFKGSTRMQIEAVRVLEKHRGQKIGDWMIKQALEYAKSRGASFIQLTTNKKRDRAKKFYESLGFEASHEGMKLHLR